MDSKEKTGGFYQPLHCLYTLDVYVRSLPDQSMRRRVCLLRLTLTMMFIRLNKSIYNCTICLCVTLSQCTLIYANFNCIKVV